MTSGVQLRAVAKAFGPVEAVRGVDFSAPSGALTAVVGPSGCGKTTTLRLVAGLETPDRGEVVVGGEVVAGPGWGTPPERRRVGVLFQQLALFPHLDVARNVAYGLRGLDRPARKARVAELLAVVGLAGYERRYPDQLSGGQAQRVALARALAPRPAVMLLDEPFASLDVALRAEVRTEVHRILRLEGVTTVLVTHDQEEALSLGDHVVVMLDGRVAQAGTPEQVYRRPASLEVARFVGEPNLVAGRVQGRAMRSELGALEVHAPDGPAVVVLHPEDLEVDDGGPHRVGEVRYFGHDQMATVVLRSGTEVRVRLPARRRLVVGAPVTVTPAVRDAVCFPAGAEAATAQAPGGTGRYSDPLAEAKTISPSESSPM